MGSFLATLVLLSVPMLRPEASLPSAPDEPRVGGVCLTCPNFDFGPFTPTDTWQTHASALTGAGDCGWYAFDVVMGTHYTFKTCGPEGSASWDTVLELYDGSCGSWFARNDQGCVPGTGASTLDRDATFSGTALLKIRPFGTTATGPYTLAYRSSTATCATCVNPRGTITLTGPCTCVSGATSATCPSNYSTMMLVAGEMYEFTTCPLVCATASATLDTVLRVLGPGCTSAAFNDDLCSLAGNTTRSTLTYTATVTGEHVVQVGGRLFSNGTYAFGSYTLCVRQLGCAPTGIVLAPTSAATNTMNCSRTQDFAVAGSAAMALPVTWTWDVTPVAGGTAVPRSGTVTSSAPGGAATFRTTLTGRGTHSVRVVGRNTCGTATLLQDYLLEDRTRPVVIAPPGTSVECPTPPPPGVPRVRDNCDASPDVALTEVTTPGPCPSAYSVRRTWIATDDAGNASAPARQVVVVTDRVPPAITPDVTTAWCVFPPDHGRACFTFTDFTPLAADACPGPISWIFARLTHSEAALGACDPPDEEPDVEIAADGSSFCVRAERCVDDPLASPGRLYLVEAIATDACGNPSPITPIATILVPQDSADTSACRAPVPW